MKHELAIDSKDLRAMTSGAFRNASRKRSAVKISLKQLAIAHNTRSRERARGRKFNA